MGLYNKTNNYLLGFSRKENAAGMIFGSGLVLNIKTSLHLNHDGHKDTLCLQPEKHLRTLQAGK